MKPPDPIPLPPHAYVPGQTARHPEGAFDAWRGTARAGMGAEELAQCRAWQAGWAFLEAGYFWEAHEVLEPVWMALPEGTTERRFVQAVIQAANAALKNRMNRPRAVARLRGIIGDLLTGLPSAQMVMGRRVGAVMEMVDVLHDSLDVQ